MKLAFVSSIFAATSGLCTDGGLVGKVQTQIQDELEASYNYQQLHMNFKSQGSNFPKLAEMLEARVDEERDHANLLIKFLHEIGEKPVLKQIGLYQKTDFTGESNRNWVNIDDVNTMEQAFNRMIAMEVSITNKLTTLLGISEGQKCETLTDLLTSEFLPEQQKDIHDLKIYKKQLSTWKNGEHMFDNLML